MPIAFDPAATTLICLADDEKRPEEQRVYFKARFITARQKSEIRRRIGEMQTMKELEDGILPVLGIAIIGPVNARDASGNPLPCSLDSIPEVLTLAEMGDLAADLPYLLTLREQDRKNSPSPSGASTGQRGAASANAETPLVAQVPLAKPNP
jgi:hypothetical protein